jgi:hypothetical protein
MKFIVIIKLGIDNSSDLVNEYCLELKSEVQLAAEEIILQVEDLSTKIIEEINEYEKELIEFNKNNSKSLDEFNKIAKELESFYAVNNEYLKQYVVDDEILLKSKAEASCLITKAKMEIDNLKTVIFDGRFFKFEKNNEKIKRSILGTSKVLNTTTIDSVILVGLEKFRNLMSLCEFPIDQKLSLIYRASRDGFEGSSFHSKCDNKPNTLTIIKSTNGNVFGGFTEQSWDYDNWYKHDPNSFIFSLINIHNKPIKIKRSKNQSICCYSDYGPSFGAYDFYIANKSNTNRESYSNLGDSFTHPEYAFGSEEAKSFLAGSYNFQVSEIEVYTKQ